jgi:outer membrane protein assembly factor BamB
LLLAAASLQRAVTHAAELLLAAGAVLAIVWGVLYRRIGFLHWALLIVAVGSIGVGTALGAWAWHEQRNRTVRGSPTVEFVPMQKPKLRPRKELLQEPWPMYGYDAGRTRSAPFHLRPPFVGLWRLQTRNALEPPGVVAYGRLFVADQHGAMFAVNGRTGRVVWRRTFPNCAAGSAAVGGGIVYQPFMHRLPCPKNQPGATGFIEAIDAKTGKTRWRFDVGVVESAPLLIGHLLYFGSWDRKVYALDVRRKRNKVVWSTATDDKVVAAPAYANGTIYVGTNGGRVYALNAKTGKVLWRADSFSHFGRREYFYAAPAVAYGRVFVGNTDGTVYAYGAGTGHLLWARQVGTYVYAAPAVWRKTVYVGTWDGYFTALDARTGEIRWRFNAPGGIMGAPTVMAGLVYFSTFGKFTQSHLRRVKSGRRATFALNARTGQTVWTFPDGHYSPIVSDNRRVYLAGKWTLYALVTETRLKKIKSWQAASKCARIRRAAVRARCLSKATRGTSSGKPGSGKAARTSRQRTHRPPSKATRLAAGSRGAKP